MTRVLFTPQSPEHTTPGITRGNISSDRELTSKQVRTATGMVCRGCVFQGCNRLQQPPRTSPNVVNYGQRDHLIFIDVQATYTGAVAPINAPCQQEKTMQVT